MLTPFSLAKSANIPPFNVHLQASVEVDRHCNSHQAISIRETLLRREGRTILESVEAAFVSSPGGGRVDFATAGSSSLCSAYTLWLPSVSISYAALRIFPNILRRLPHVNLRRAAMSALFSGVDDTPAPLDEDAYRAWLISRAQPPIVYHSGAMHLKRLRVLARRINSHVRAAFATIHQAILAAKTRRIRRELIFHAGSHDEWSRSKWPEAPGSDGELRDFPQTPMILGDKWDS
jgi:hypothetical protein